MCVCVCVCVCVSKYRHTLMYMQLLEMMHGIIMQMHRQQHFGEGDMVVCVHLYG